MNTDQKKNNIYFVGAGGIGMAALVRWFLSRKCAVAGYDRTPSALTSALINEGAQIVFDENPDLIPESMRNPETTLVVYTPAVPATHAGLTWFRNNGFEVVKRAAVLGRVTRELDGLCFAGTHGKTTTSSMAAHILHQSGIGCNAFLGGVLRNYGTNLLLSESSHIAVIEADEYDRSFHQLTPHVAVITATDPDHLDIYGTEEAYLESFAHFTELIRPDGTLIVHEGLKLKPRPATSVRVLTYSRDKGDFHATNIRRGNGRIVFDLVAPDRTITDIELGVPVEVNIDNAIAATAGVLTACTTPISDDAIRKAHASFLGAKRRFEFWLREDGPQGRAIIDDYAHHPDELTASIRSVKALYPDRKLTVAFQPHLYSRTRDFAPEFARALSLADEVILLDIYPARELPIPGVTSKIIFDAITCPEKTLIATKDLTNTVKNRKFEILLTVGAGNIDSQLPAIVEAVKK
jgi:UDP-N-acetylmuramate--alanine ligase